MVPGPAASGRNKIPGLVKGTSQECHDVMLAFPLGVTDTTEDKRDRAI